MYRLLFLISTVFFAGSVAAQNELYDEPVIIYSHQMSGGLQLHSNGLGGFFQWGKYQGAKKIMLLGIDAVNMKHPKEVKSYNPVYEDSRSYVYGKVNNLYILRPSFGYRKIITEKLRKSGVQVGYTLTGGPSLGITKPVYLEIGYPAIPYQYLATERYDPDRHFFDDIYGRASGLNGLDDLKLHPGGFVKFAFNFEYSNEKDRLKGLEAGVTLDAYLREIPIMAEDRVANNQQFFFTFFLNFFVGKKYNVNG
ncbi:hypothetical protein [Sanyastnella coralliicola]|uniref:hypothetical protein n=1 Tax=Sanyastnella coralliicola TaxID=3069118 RepID=UPI0027B8CA80|nr:hypothetical protein [Longitalea sp. SCSIO 12813]